MHLFELTLDDTILQNDRKLSRDNEEVPLDQKTIEFFNGIQELIETIYGNNRTEFLIYLVMLLNLLCIIQVSSLDLRLALMVIVSNFNPFTPQNLHSCSVTTRTCFLVVSLQEEPFWFNTRWYTS